MGKKKVVQKSGEQSAANTAEASVKTGGSKKARAIERGKVYISATYNNTIVSATDLRGNVLAWASAGSLGFSGPKKATPFAASKIISVIAEKLTPFGMREIEVFVKGVGSGRDSALRSLANRGFNIILLRDLTPIPHNGPRPPKVRRV